MRKGVLRKAPLLPRLLRVWGDGTGYGSLEQRFSTLATLKICGLAAL